MSSTAKPKPTTDNNNTTYNETLLLIRPLQPLLAGFNHRNKNQHRVATWWASFNMLRRHVTKWADELDQQAKSRPPKKRKRIVSAQGGDDNDTKKKTEDGPAEVRALWLRDVLVPKCYLAFSQLAADNQFAALGLVLTGALAQVYNACVRLAGETPSETAITVRLKAPMVDISKPDIFASSSSATTIGKRKNDTLKESSSSTSAVRRVPTGPDEHDVGQVISRDSIRAAKVATESPTEEERLQKVKRRKKTVVSAADDDIDGDVEPKKMKKKEKVTSGQPKVEDGEKVTKKKKKKSKKGDEFDSLFDSLF
ncbi:hypothetical protein PG999_007065 [Apiospora kogelbergensis]|uniref:RNase MRP protein 1 RNA binding domain-containing protein n=1 Tax=Apiospora kogelbergensis TaxID=1337665 RepID=A0AAW0QXA8_9PEZI